MLEDSVPDEASLGISVNVLEKPQRPVQGAEGCRAQYVQTLRQLNAGPWTLYLQHKSPVALKPVLGVLSYLVGFQ